MIFVVAPIVAQAACRNPYQDAMVVQYVQPAYPDSARELGLGVVTAKVVVTVSPVGSLLGARIYQSAGNMAMDQAALSAARQSTYSPKVVNCQPVTGDFLLTVTLDPKASPSPGFVRGYVPPTPPPGPGPVIPPAEEACQSAAAAASYEFEILQQRRDYDRAFQSATEAARVQMDCARSIKTPQRFSLEMLAGSTLSRAADLAYNLERYQQARDFAAKANAIYADLTAPSIDQNYGRFLTPNAKANIQANDDLMRRATAQEKCGSDVSGPIRSLVLRQMPGGSAVRSVGIQGNYAVAIAFGPGGYAVRSFLLIKRNVWKILASEGGAFDLAAYRRHGVPASVAAKLTAAGDCGP